MHTRLAASLCTVLLTLAGCGADAPSDELGTTAADATLKTTADLLLTPFGAGTPPPEVLRTEQRLVLRDAATFRAKLKLDPGGIDFNSQWAVFYTAGTRPTAGFVASVVSVRPNTAGTSLAITTRLASPGATCKVVRVGSTPYALVFFAKPGTAPAAQSFTRSDLVRACPAPTTCAGPVCGAGHSLTGSTFTAGLEVENRSFQKYCSARLTCDGWMTQLDLPASYVGPTARSGYERWEVGFSSSGQIATQCANVATAAVIEYALACSFDGGDLFWDSNGGANYKLDRSKPVRTQWETSFQNASALALAADGRTFVLSSDGNANMPMARWVSGYSAAGAWQWVSTFDANVQSLVWLERSGLLLVQLATGTPTWLALSPEGRVLWKLAANLSMLVRGTTADYLVGAAGAAAVGATLPALIGPAAGCAYTDSQGAQSLPVVSRTGLLYCRAGAAVQVWSLATGRLTATLAQAANPWAAGDDGTAVLVTDDRTTLIAMRAGREVYRKTGLYVAPNVSSGVGRDCPNRAAGGIAAFLQQSPSGNAGGHAIVGFTVSTGTQRWRTDVSEYSAGACPDADGTFLFAPSYMRYANYTYRVAPTTGALTTLNYGFFGRDFGAQADGRRVRREWPYYASNPRARVIVTGADLAEHFSRTFDVPSSPYGTAAVLVAAMAGDRLVLADAHKLTAYTFAP